LTAGVKEAWIARMPHLRIIDGFGSSETGSQGQTITAAGSEPMPRARFELNDDVQVFDEDNRVAPVGVVGRLARTGHIPLGYHNDAVKTAETFPVIDGARWSIPGDYAVRADDGTITVLGRGSVCINTGGEKVYPEEVEAALKSHPGVVDALVVGVPDERWGERVVAVVAPSPGTELSLEALNENVREHVAGYKVPRALVLVDAVVRSPAGKPDYVWARNLALGQSDPRSN
jgi:fatty-acyl-CoA synthase